MRVLVVDDEPDILKVITWSLNFQEPDWEVLTASGGGRALELVAQEGPDIVLLDVAMPEMDEEQRSELPSNVITRALGMQDRVAVDLQAVTLEEGDVYVLCSDGLSGMMSDDELLDLLVLGGSPAQMCERLIQRANDNGGEDNVTAVLMQVQATPLGEDTDDDSASYRGKMETDLSELIS